MFVARKKESVVIQCTLRFNFILSWSWFSWYSYMYRCGSTPVSTVLWKLVRFFIINISYNNSRTFQVEIWKMVCTMFSFSNFRAFDAPSMNHETQERELWGVNIQKNSEGCMPPGSSRSSLPQPLL